MRISRKFLIISVPYPRYIVTVSRAVIQAQDQHIIFAKTRQKLYSLRTPCGIFYQYHLNRLPAWLESLHSAKTRMNSRQCIDHLSDITAKSIISSNSRRGIVNIVDSRKSYSR